MSAPSATSDPWDHLAFPDETAARRTRAKLVGHVLQRGRLVTDDAFDEVYPTIIRDLSSVHWTPVRVAARIVELLELRDGERLLDVGAGVGKFCMVAAAMSRAKVHGIELRPELAAIAREAARRLGVTIEIAEGRFQAALAASFDAAYFFNPFALPLLLPGRPAYAADRWAGYVGDDVTIAEEFLERARSGTRIVTFCGFGGTVPSAYELRTREPWDGAWLELWRKRS